MKKYFCLIFLLFLILLLFYIHRNDDRYHKLLKGSYKSKFTSVYLYTSDGRLCDVLNQKKDIDYISLMLGSHIDSSSREFKNKCGSIILVDEDGQELKLCVFMCQYISKNSRNYLKIFVPGIYNGEYRYEREIVYPIPDKIDKFFSNVMERVAIDRLSSLKQIC